MRERGPPRVPLEHVADHGELAAGREVVVAADRLPGREEVAADAEHLGQDRRVI